MFFSFIIIQNNEIITMTIIHKVITSSNKILVFKKKLRLTV